jgi:murein DD-endopeptidase MepM/ murein hydrolase activator NlpD
MKIEDGHKKGMITPPVRGQDDYGSGQYLAPRGTREHQGIDFAAYPSSTLLSPVKGKVKRIVQPFAIHGPKGHFSGLEIQVDIQTRIKIMYVLPLANPGDRITIGQNIGLVQDLSGSYPEVKQDGVTLKRQITNHYHLEVWVEGQHVDPIPWLEQYKERHK